MWAALKKDRQTDRRTDRPKSSTAAENDDTELFDVMMMSKWSGTRAHSMGASESLLYVYINGYL